MERLQTFLPIATLLSLNPRPGFGKKVLDTIGCTLEKNTEQVKNWKVGSYPVPVVDILSTMMLSGWLHHMKEGGSIFPSLKSDIRLILAPTNLAL